MELHHEFTVPTDPDQAIALLRDVELLAPCMPGATLETNDGTTFAGNMRMKVGAVQLTYQGTGRILESVGADRELALEFKATETRGAGGANARVTCTVVPDTGGSRVSVDTDLDITGRPAQFGRGVITEIGDRVVGTFATNLAQLLEGRATSPAGLPDPAATLGEPRPERVTAPTGAEPLDVMALVGPVLARRALPVAGVVAAAALGFWVGRLSAELKLLKKSL